MKTWLRCCYANFHSSTHMKDDLNQTPFDVAAPKLKPKFNEAFLGCLKSVRQSLLSTPGRIPLDQLQRHVTEKWAEASKSDDDWAKVATILHKSNDLCSAAAKELKKDIAFPDLKHIEKELLIDTGIQVGVKNALQKRYLQQKKTS